MKQRLLILAAAGSVLFAACGGNNEGSMTAAQADSLAQAKADSVAAALKAQNDSTIAAQAAEQARIQDSIRVADSLLAAGKKAGAASVTKKSTSGTKKPGTPSKEEPKKEEPKTPGGLRGQGDNSKQGGLRNQGDRAKQEQSSSSGGGLRSKGDRAKQGGQ